MEWTQAQPTQEGYYWQAWGDDLTPKGVALVEVNIGYGPGPFWVARAGEYDGSDYETDTWWYGPIEKPAHPQAQQAPEEGGGE